RGDARRRRAHGGEWGLLHLYGFRSRIWDAKSWSRSANRSDRYSHRGIVSADCGASLWCAFRPAWPSPCLPVRRRHYRTVRISTVLVVRYRISRSDLARSRPGARLGTSAHVWTPGGVPFGVVWNASPLQRCIPWFAALVCRFRRPLSVYRDGAASLWAGGPCSVHYWDGSDYDRCSVHGVGDATPRHRLSETFPAKNRESS